MLAVAIRSAYELEQEFEAHGRGESYSYQGFEALYEYLSGLVADVASPQIIDVVGLCGDYDEVEPDEFEDYEHCTLIAELDNGNRLYGVV